MLLTISYAEHSYMRTSRIILCLLMIAMTSAAIAQRKGEMPFTSSSKNANKSLRNAWVALADFKVDEGNKYMHEILNEDPDCGMCYASLFPFDDEEAVSNLRKASSMNLSPDEQMFIDGVIARRENRSNESYFEPLIEKYPSDAYLHLWIMLNSSNNLRAIELGENLIKRNAKLAPAYNLLGYLYMNQNDMAKAQTYFDRYIALAPHLANPYDSKADFLMKTGNVEEAIPLYEKAVAMGMKASETKLAMAKARLEFPTPTAEDATSIREILQAGFIAYKDRNTDEFTKNFSEQSLEILPDQRVNVGRANLRHRASQNFKYFTVLKNEMDVSAINGAGPIAIVYGKVESAIRDSASGKENEQTWNSIFLFRKDINKNWKVLANHFYGMNEGSQPITADDRNNIDKLFAAWDKALPNGESLTEMHFDAFAKQYSPQAIEIFSNQIANVGLPNLRVRWQNHAGARMESNALRPIGVEGLGRRAVAWGIGVQGWYPKNSDELQKFQFPWAMILTKEQDNVWRILAIHWGQ